jgi:hypothetical protein
MREHLDPRPNQAPACVPDATGRCATCADEGVEALVVAVLDDATAAVQMEGRRQEVAIELLEGIRAGDRVLVHAGVAIARLEG